MGVTLPLGSKYLISQYDEVHFEHTDLLLE